MQQPGAKRTISKAALLSKIQDKKMSDALGSGARGHGRASVHASSASDSARDHHAGGNHTALLLQGLAEQVSALAASQAELTNVIAGMRLNGTGDAASIVGAAATAAATTAASRRVVTPAAPDPAHHTSGTMSKAHYGDQVSLMHEFEGRSGFLTGDMVLRSCGIELIPEKGDSRPLPQTSLEFSSNVFAIVPMLAYRARGELRKFNKRVEALRANDEDGAADAKKDRKQKKVLFTRNAGEEESNAETLSHVLAGAGDVIKYGDVVQLLHVNTGLFVKLSKKTALIDKDNRLVCLRSGSPGVYLKLLPRFKTRALGTPVYFDDELVFASVKLDGTILSVSHGPEFYYPSAWEHTSNPDAEELPAVLQRNDISEVNGGRNVCSFIVNKFARNIPDENCLKANDMFRLYHPVAEGFVRASCDSDKRRFLRAAKREDGSDPHQPYCAKLEEVDPNHPRNRSAKAVWTFEYIDRSTGGNIRWNTPMRIRHVSSGKFLSVDTVSPLSDEVAAKHGVTGGRAYSCALVRMPSATAPAGALGSEESLVFQVSPSDASEGSLPHGVTTLRVEHDATHDDGTTISCFFHHTPREISSFAQAFDASEGDDDGEGIFDDISKLRRKGERFLFTTVRYPQDVLRLLPLEDSEAKDVAYISNLIKPLKLYSYAMINAIDAEKDEDGAEFRFPKAATDLIDSIAGVLLRVIQYNTDGAVEVILQRSTPEWLKLATNNLPAKFATFFTGDPNTTRQKISCEAKLIDAVFEVAISAYNRFSKFRIQGKSPFAPRKAPAGFSPDDKDDFEEEDRMERTNPTFICKLAHVGLQRLFKGLAHNEAYFSRRESLLRPLMATSNVPEPKQWVRIISSQSEDPLGATVTLSRLLGSNEKIARQIVTPTLLLGFLDLIQRNGPQPRLIQLFSSVCICSGKAITSNQEMVLRMLWLDASAKNGALIDILELSSDAALTYNAVSGKANTRPDFSDTKAPPDFLGKPQLQAGEGFSPVYVRWTGNKDWVQGSDDLFYNWEGLGIDSSVVKKSQGQDCIPIEWLCYVLEPKRLTLPVTKKEFAPFNEEAAGDEELLAHARFKSHCQLADYFVAQLQLLTKMAKGRSYNVISWLTDDGKGEKPRGFSYTMLIGIASNPTLPFNVRSESIYLLIALYVDRFPQLPRSGRPTLPEKLWVANAGDDDSTLIPSIRKIQLDDREALPAFSLAESHDFYGNEDPVLGFPDDYKFYMLRRLSNDLIKSFGGYMILSNVEENTFACAALDASKMLLSFGFSANYTKLQELCRPAATILDGRSDEETLDHYFVPAVHRWQDLGSAGFAASTRAKKAVISLLSDVSDYRANYRLARILWVFKTLHDGSSTISEALTEFCNNPTGDDDSPILQLMFDEFEKLFDASDDAVKLDLAELTGQPVSDILMDCIMYEDDSLFEQALKLLDRRFGQRRKLLEVLNDAYILDGNGIDLFSSVNTLQSRLGTLLFSVRSTSTWCVHSVVSGTFDDKRYQDVQAFCKDLVAFLRGRNADTKSLEHPPGTSARVTGLQKNPELNDRNATITGVCLDSTGMPRYTVQLDDGKSMKLKPECLIPVTTEKSSREISPKEANPHHQNILRSMDVYTILVTALSIDINIAFKGSKCTIWQKLKSQNMLISTLESLLKVLLAFIYRNKANQGLFFSNLSRIITLCFTELVKLPTKPQDYPAGDKPYPEDNPNSAFTIRELAKTVVIELIRGNAYIAKHVPLSTFEIFAEVIDEFKEGDATTSPDIEFLFVAAYPETFYLRRNQNIILQQLLRPDLKQLSHCLKNSFFAVSTAVSGSTVVPCKDALRMIKLVRSCADNAAAIQKLSQESGLTLKAILREATYVIAAAMKSSKKPSRRASTRRASLSPTGGTVEDDIVKVRQIFCRNGAEEQRVLMLIGEELLKYVGTVQDLTPHDPEFIRDPILWNFLKVAESALGSFDLNPDDLFQTRVVDGVDISAELCGMLMKIVENFLSAAASHGLLEEVKQAKSKWAIISNISNVHARHIASHINAEASETADEDIVMAGAAANLIKACGFNEEPLNQTVQERANTIALALPKAEVIAAQEESKTKDTLGIYQTRLNEFILAVNSSPGINEILRLRRFALVEHLARGMPGYLDARGNVNEIEGVDIKKGQAEITWPMIVTRFAVYGETHIFEEDEEHMVRIFSVLRYHLVQARAVQPGQEDDAKIIEAVGDSLIDGAIDFNELNLDIVEPRSISNKVKAMLSDHEARVKVLIDHKVMNVVYSVIAHRELGCQMSESAFMLAQELLHGANSCCQTKVAELINADYENTFLTKMIERIDLISDEIHEQRRLQRKEPTDEAIKVFEVGIATMQYLQGLCENHFRPNQDLLRTQRGHAGSIDVIKSVSDLSLLFCEDSATVGSLSATEIEVVQCIFEFLADAMQGPCPENQMQIAKSEAVVAISNMLLATDNIELRFSAICMLKSCLEGRSDLQVHNTLGGSVEAVMLEQYESQLLELAKRLQKKLKKDPDAKEELEDVMDGIVAVKTIEAELMSTPAYVEQKVHSAQVGAGEESEDEDEDDEDEDDEDEETGAGTESLIDFVEIYWRGEIERCVFSPPLYTKYLKEDTKRRFLANVDLSTTERRNKELVRHIDDFSEEMKNVAGLARRFKWYKFVDKHFDTIKIGIYGLVMLLNLNVMLSSERLKSPYNILYECPESEMDAFGFCPIEGHIHTSMVITCTLGALNFTGYFIIVGFLALTEVPLLITKTRQFAIDAVNDKNIKPSEYFNWEPFIPSALFLGFVGIFALIHSANFEPYPTMYWMLLALVFLLFCRGLRRSVVVPYNVPLQFFTITYDLVITKPFLRNHVGLQVFSFLGFQDNQWFTLMLFDIFNNSSVLQDIVRSITVPAPKLIMIFYTIIITVAVFATFGFRAFGTTEFQPGDDVSRYDDDEFICHSALSCFMYIFYAGVPGGSITDLMRAVTINDGPHYWNRIAYDLIFFIWMGILLFNIITGLMLDTFSALREEANEREDTLANSCFICGITRAAYDDLGLGNDAPSFDVHIEEEHSIWSYVNFLADLKDKNAHDFDGRETFVHEQITNGSLNWLPNRTSLHIENQRREAAGEDPAGDSDDE